ESISTELARAEAGIEHVFVPVGGGGLYSAVARGFQAAGLATKVHAIQPAGCSTVVASFVRGDDEIRPVLSTTRVSGLSVPFDIDAGLALGHLRACGGRGFAVSDEAVFAAQVMMLEQEGIYCEPGGATALAGWLEALEKGGISPRAAGYRPASGGPSRGGGAGAAGRGGLCSRHSRPRRRGADDGSGGGAVRRH